HLLVVLDDAVVHHRDAAAHVRMGVALGGHAVRRPARVADADVAGEPSLERKPGERSDAAAAAQALHAAVDHRDARRVVAAVFEPPQPLEQDRHDVAASYGCDDSAHEAFLRMSSAAATARAAEASATRSRSSSALRSGVSSWCSSSSRLKAMTEASTASGARPAVPRHKSAVINAKHTKCAALSQCGGRRSAPMKTSASMMPTPV